LIPLADLQKLYDENRFLEAFRQTAEYWKGPPALDGFSVDELILGGRLASRLGGWRLCRWLYRAAAERDPSSPRVRYYAGRLRRGRLTILDHLRDLEARPLLDTDDAELQSSWLAWNGVLWGTPRDFARAHDYIERARGFYASDGWVSSCESDVRGMADDWDEALNCAALSWELNPGAPYAAHSLGNSLLNLGRVREAAERLGRAADSGESCEIASYACWQQCALAETLEGAERNASVSRARELAEKLTALAPLADRECRTLFATIHLDLAQFADDHDEMERWAREVRSPFYHRVLSNLRKSPSGARIRLAFQRKLQKHLTCLPTSLSSALATMNVNVDADAMAAEITYGGTTDWAAAEWLENRGLKVRSFVVTREAASRLIRNGISFVLSLEGDDFAHAVAVVGLDEAAGTLLVHDPQQFRTTEYLLDWLEHQAPLGPRGMAVVPLEKASRLEELLPATDVDVMTASRSYYRALHLYGPTVAAAFVTELETRHPSHPVTRLLRATQAVEEGRAGDALAGFQRLLEEFPGHPAVRARLLHACRSLGNTALLRNALESVVERGVLPGAESRQSWLHPPSAYVWQYADLLRLSAATKERARRLLHSVMRREPSSADVWHTLADPLWSERDFEGALLSYRIASCLAESKDHHARAYQEALALRGRLDEGLRWLEKRVRDHRSSPYAISTWLNWIGALETSGRPDEALAACAEALETHGASTELMAFAVRFLARMGQWDEAQGLLGRLESGGNPALLHEAAVDFHGMKGELDEAIRHAEAWVQESPLSVPAKMALVDQIAARDGTEVALDRARRFLSERPGNDRLEELCCLALDRAAEPPSEKALLLRRRVKRNPEDAWAWRELAATYLVEYDEANARRRERLRLRINEILAECERTAPDSPATVRAKAGWAEARGEWKDAVALWLESIEGEPGNRPRLSTRVGRCRHVPGRGEASGVGTNRGAALRLPRTPPRGP
jgi:tetratricopeptide (TPR) repeat protein